MRPPRLLFWQAVIVESWNDIKPVIGMLHLLPLPGAPRYGGALAPIRQRVLDDARKLEDGGVNGLMLENFGDTPFYPGAVPAETIAHMSALAVEVRRIVPKLPLGINVLRNDGLAALAIAHAAGAQYIRVNVLCGARLSDQGILQGIAHELLRLRVRLGAEQIRILADVDVKHSAALAARPIVDEVDDTIERGLADALIVSGAGTGKPTDPVKFQRVKQATKATPVFLGSGISPTTVGKLWADADGFIVGSYFKTDGDAHNPVELSRVQSFMASLPKEPRP